MTSNGQNWDMHCPVTLNATGTNSAVSGSLQRRGNLFVKSSDWKFFVQIWNAALSLKALTRSGGTLASPLSVTR